MYHNRKTIYLAGFIFSLPIALMSYINSSFISLFVDEKLVGVVYALGSVASIVALLVVPQIFRKAGGYKFLLWIIGLDALSILLFAFSDNILSIVLSFILSFTLNTLVFFSLDELLKIFSRDASIGKSRGIYVTFCNLAWIISQLALGVFLGELSFKAIYIISFLMLVLFFTISYWRLRDIPDPKYDKVKTIKYVGTFLRNKNLFRAYGISLLVQFFFCWMIIYTPIYLSLHMDFSWKEIGMIFAIMLLPFSIITFPLGKYADKMGERKILMFGFAIASLGTLALFFIGQHSIWMWAFWLFITRVGAASIEIMSDTYFFRHIAPENDEYVGVYRSAAPISYILGPLLAFVVFSFVPSFNFIFLVLGMIMLFGVYLSGTIKNQDI